LSRSTAARSWAWPWLAPALALCVLGLGLPLLRTAFLALDAPWARLWSDARLLHSAAFTLGFALVSVALETALALALALALARPLPWSGLWKACLLLPWALPAVVSTRLWAWLFNYQFGLANLGAQGLGLDAINWFAGPLTAWIALLVVEIWKTTPLLALLLLAGRQQISDNVYEAAALDGAGPWRSFSAITLPLLRPILVVALLFRIVDALRLFDAVWVLTGGGPARSTESLTFYTYALFFREGDAAYGSLVSLLYGLSLLLAAVWVSRLGRFERDLKEAA
jgi:multiple sugar transport system permease protein